MTVTNRPKYLVTKHNKGLLLAHITVKESSRLVQWGRQESPHKLYTLLPIAPWDHVHLSQQERGNSMEEHIWEVFEGQA